MLGFNTTNRIAKKTNNNIYIYSKINHKKTTNFITQNEILMISSYSRIKYK